MTVRRTMALIATLGLAMAFAPAVPAQASGGGGCGGPVSEGSGTEVEIELYCFSPTVLYAETGDEVMWTNLDPAPHNVGGANLAWGSFEQLRQGRSVGYSFTEPGVYSYVCSMHPGMVGTVVVGDPGAGDALANDEIQAIRAAGTARTGPTSAAVVAGGLAVWMIGLVLGAWMGRRRVTLEDRRKPAS